MKIKYFFILIAFILLVVSLWWGISQNSLLEPWTAVLSAILGLLGILFSSDSKSKTPEMDISQSNFLSFFNSSIAKKIKGKIKQWNIGSLGNTQKIED
jgi:purine-cytosine permease-like protein